MFNQYHSCLSRAIVYYMEVLGHSPEDISCFLEEVKLLLARIWAHALFNQLKQGLNDTKHQGVLCLLYQEHINQIQHLQTQLSMWGVWQTGKQDGFTQSTYQWVVGQLEGAEENYLQLRSTHILVSFLLLGHGKLKTKIWNWRLGVVCWFHLYFVQWHHLERTVTRISVTWPDLQSF